MTIIPILVKEMEQEAQTTRKMLSRIPDDKYLWKPHERSMTIQQLATHIAELPTWVSMVLDTEELDFEANAYAPTEISNTADLMALLEKSLTECKSRLEIASDDNLLPIWTLRNGEQIYLTSTKGEMIRTCFSQIVHHRAQLGVYLRLLEIPIPGSYGPSADDISF